MGVEGVRAGSCNRIDDVCIYVGPTNGPNPAVDHPNARRGLQKLVRGRSAAASTQPPLHPKTLAYYIENDPVFRILLDSGRILEKGNIKDITIGTRTVSQEKQKALIRLARQALRYVVDPNLEINDKYDDRMRAALAKLQKSAHMKGPDGKDLDGSALRSNELGVLIMRCRYSRQEMTAMLDGKIAQLDGKQIYPFYLNQDWPTNELFNTASLALTWLGYLNFSKTPPTKSDVATALNSSFNQKNIAIIGPNILRGLRSLIV